MCWPFLSDLSVYGSLIIRESERCGVIIYADESEIERERIEPQKRRCVFFCSVHTISADVALSRAWTWGSLFCFSLLFSLDGDLD